MHTYRRLVIALKKAYPKYKVSVRKAKVPEGYDGYTIKVGVNQWLIKISNELKTEEEFIGILLHEFPHVPAWDEFTVLGIEHGPQWGVEHSRCYQIFEEINR